MPMALIYLIAIFCGCVFLIAPIWLIALSVRSAALKRQLKELAEETAKQQTKLQRIIGELQTKLAALSAEGPAKAERVAPEVPSVPPAKSTPPVPVRVEAKPPAPVAPAPPVPISPTQTAEKKPEPIVEVRPPAPAPTAPASPVVAAPLPSVTPAVAKPPAPPEQKPLAPAAQAPPHTEPPKAAPLLTPPAPPKATPPPSVPPPLPKHTPLAAEVPPAAAARISSPPLSSSFRVPAPRPTMKDRMRAVSALEDALGTNWFAKLGGIMVVIGVTSLGLIKLQSFGAAGKAIVSFLVAFLFLAGGIYLEKRERYRLLGRVGIGCGWATLFFSVYGIYHVGAMHILDSLLLDSVLMLAVAAGMAIHTLRYQSQFVTGLAFLLGYTTIALSFSEVHSATSAATAQGTAYGLVAGLMLAVGLVAIVGKMGWYELEIFGILSSFLNHLYWLYNLLGIAGARGHTFPEYHASLAILFFYWLTFRISYVVRSIKTDFEEHVSTVAALLNTLLLLGLLKFQSVQPELAYIGLLVIGALEFAFAQLPPTRRRRRAFVLLNVLGAALMLASVPFHYSGNPVAILWLIGAEVFLAAGIVSKEVVFRRLGLWTGVLVGIDLLAFDFRPILELRAKSEEVALATGILFALCGVVLYFNALGLGSRWEQFFENILDRRALALHSYLGAFASATAIWALFSYDWTAVAFAILMLLLAAICRRAGTFHVQVQYALLGALTLYRVVAFNLHVGGPSDTHIATRLMTLPILAAAFYLTARLAALGDGQGQQTLRGLFAMAGTGLLALLIWFEAPELWQPVAYIAFAVALSEGARLLRYRALAFHGHAVALLAVFTALTADESKLHIWRTIPWHAIAALPVVAGCYWLAKRAGTDHEQHLRLARIAYTWVAAGVMVWILEEGLHAPWIAVGWMGFAVALALATRRIRYPQLAWQANVVALAAFARTYFFNLDLHQPLWRGVSLRLFTVSLVIAGAYVLAKIAVAALTEGKSVVRNVYTWAGALFVGLLIWYEAPEVWKGVLFLAAGIVLALAGRRWSQWHLGLQEHLFAIAAVARTLDYNYHAAGHYGAFTVRLITVSLVAAGLYAISRRATAAEAPHALPMAYLHTTAATSLLALLMWYEVSAPGWLAALWAVFACALALVDRRFELDDLRWQAHGLAALALLRGVSVNLYVVDTWHGISIRLLSLSIVAVIFYAMSRIVRMPEEWRAADFHHTYSWAASLLVSLLLWYELQPLSIAVGMAVFGLVLFEYGALRKVAQFRYQACVALIAAFARIFFANLTAGEPGEFWGPRLYTVLPLALILFFVYVQMPRKEETPAPRLRIRFDSLMAYLGTATVVALFYFQFSPEWVVTSYAVVALALFAAAWALDRPIFLHQGILVTLGTFARGMAHNLFGSGYFGEGDWRGRYFVVGAASAILLTSLYFAFAMRGRYSPPATASRWRKVATALVARPEQLQFFIPAILITTMLALKMKAGWVTVSWGVEGLCIVLLALAVKERSFRLTGLGMLVLCVGRVFAMDVWRLESGQRWVTLTVVGAALIAVNWLYLRYRENIQQYL